MSENPKLLHELTMLYLNKLDLNKLEPSGLYDLYWDIFQKIGKNKPEDELAKVEIGKRSLF